MDDALLARWRAIVGPEGDTAGRDLLLRWAEPHRRYHNAAHLRAVLEAIDDLARHADDPDAVRLAAWFHDAVYEGRPGDDERASAALAERELTMLDLPRDRVMEVVRLVELTAHHDAEPGDANGAVMCDADLAVLGGEPEAYSAYAAAVRDEYSAVPDAQFRRGRAEVLRQLIAHEPLYRTPTATARWEAAARRNLTAELALLSVS